MRALIITDSMIWNAETEYALAVAAAEAAMGLDVTVAAPRGSEALKRVPTGVAAARLPGTDIGRSPADLLAAGRFVAAFLADHPGSIVHSSRSPAHVAAAFVRTPRTSLIHLRGGAAPPSGGAMNRFLYRRRTDAVIASSERVATWVRERLGVDPARVVRMHLPVDIERFAAAPDGDARMRVRTEFGIGPDVPLVVNVARLAPVKGHDVLLNAWAAVRRERADAVLLLVGEPWSGQPEGLLARASELGVADAVHFAGRREDIPAVLAAADVCVCSSVGSEENSRAVSEYMAAARAVVATGVGVIPELVADGESGRVVLPSDAAALGSALLELLGSPERAAAMGAVGRARVDALCSREAFARRLGEVLESSARWRGEAPGSAARGGGLS